MTGVLTRHLLSKTRHTSSNKGRVWLCPFAWEISVNRLAPSALNQMSFSKVLSAYSLHPAGDTWEFSSFGRAVRISCKRHLKIIFSFKILQHYIILYRKINNNIFILWFYILTSGKSPNNPLKKAISLSKKPSFTSILTASERSSQKPWQHTNTSGLYRSCRYTPRRTVFGLVCGTLW